MAKAKQIKAKTKKKRWMPIVAPKSFNSTVLGETYVAEAEEALDKSVRTNLMVLADDPRKQMYNLRFDIHSVKDGKAETQLISIEMTPSYIKRLIRRNRDKIEDSFIVRIAGGRMVRVKPVIVTRTLTSKPAQTEIRLMVRQKIKEIYNKMRMDDIVHDMIEGRTQRILKDICSKTHPVRSADIRHVSVHPQDRKLTKEMEEQMEKEAKAEEEKRQQLESAAKAAAVEEENPKLKKTKKPSKKKDDDSEE